MMMMMIFFNITFSEPIIINTFRVCEPKLGEQASLKRAPVRTNCYLFDRSIEPFVSVGVVKARIATTFDLLTKV